MTVASEYKQIAESDRRIAEMVLQDGQINGTAELLYEQPAKWEVPPTWCYLCNSDARGFADLQLLLVALELPM